MSVVEAYLFAEVESTDSATPVVASVNSYEDPPLDSELLCSVVSDGTADEAILAQTLAPVVAGVSIRVGGEEVPPDVLVNGWSVTRSLNQAIQQASFSVQLTAPRGRWGPPWEHAGPSTCLREIDVHGVYETSTGLHYVPLMLRGIADTGERELSLAGGGVDSFEVADNGGRYDRRKVSVNLPPGHGLDRISGVIGAMARKAGVTRIRLPVGGTCTKEIVRTDAEWLPIASELAGVEGRAILWSRDAYLIAPRTGKPVEGEEVATWNFGAADLDAASPVRIQSRGDVVTEVTLTGEKQVTRTDPCDIEVTRTERTTRSLYTRRTPPFVQSLGGYSANPQSSAPSAAVLSGISVHEREMRCGSLVWERITEYGYIDPECARYEWDSGLSDRKRLACYSNSDADDSAAAYQYPIEYWGVLKITERWRYYNADGFRRQFEPGQSEEMAMLTGTTVSETREGDFLGSLERVSEFASPRAAVKERVSLSTDWETIDPANGTKLFGNGESPADVADPWAVVGAGAFNPAATHGYRLRASTETIEAHLGDAGGLLRTVHRAMKGWVAPYSAASYYLYGDGREASEPNEVWGVSGSEIEQYETLGKSSHSRSLRRYDANGARIPAFDEDESGLDGAGPAIDRLNLPESNPELYADAEEMGANVQLARRGDTETIKVTVVADQLLACHAPNSVVASSPWIENEEEAQQVARRIIEENAALGLTVVPVVPNFFLTEGDVMRLTLPEIDLDKDVRIVSVAWSGDAQGRISTNVGGKLYGF